MRNAEVSLPKEISLLAYDVKNEIERILTDSESDLNYLYLVLQISSLAEQSMKIIRSMIVGQKSTNDNVKNYFTLMNSSEPLYAKNTSFKNMLKKFDIKVQDYSWSSSIIYFYVIIFENKDDYESFEDQFSKWRNMAAHEVMPNFLISKKEIIKSYDFVITLISFFSKQLEILNKYVDTAIYSYAYSIDKYEESFMSVNLFAKYKSIVYTNAVFENIDNEKHKCVLFIKFDIRKSLSNEEIDQIILRYFNTHIDIRGEIISRKSNDFQLLSGEEVLDLEDCIISSQLDKLKDIFSRKIGLLNYPMYISKDNAIFGKIKIQTYLKIT